jgi:hypothetical protein
MDDIEPFRRHAISPRIDARLPNYCHYISLHAAVHPLFLVKYLLHPICLVWLATVAWAAHDDPRSPLPIGADAWLRWDLWPYQRIGARAYMRSTYDRSGGNDDASHFLYQVRNDYNVTLDVAGPGILYFARYNHWHGSPWHYEVDGKDHVVSESGSADPEHMKPGSIFQPASAFPHPLAVTWSETQGADLSWVPIEFTRSFRMAYSRTHYGTGYYIFDKYVEGTPIFTPIKAWDEETPPASLLSLFDSAGSDIAPKPGQLGVSEQSGSVDLAAGGSAILWQRRSGPEMVRAIEFSVERTSSLRFSDVRIKVRWDDRKDLSIDAPIALFFGAGVLYNRSGRDFLVKGFPMVVRYSTDRVYLSCFFPMPFFRRAELSLQNSDGVPFRDVRWRIRTQPFLDSPRGVGYFHATYRDHPNPEAGQDLVLLDTRGTEGSPTWTGQFVGTSLIFSQDAHLETLEGDPRFFFDDSQTPQAQGTGTEEWCGGGDYWGGQNMTLPFAGHPAGARKPDLAVSSADKIETAYRFLLGDMMPFGRNARIQLEHGGIDESTEHYETVTYWYGLPAASLILSDTLSVGDPASEAEHSYSSPDASPVQEVTSRYEWGPDTLNGKECYPATLDHGRVTNGSSEFELKVDPHNVGVLLRRKLDYSYPNQRARVYVSNPESGSPGWSEAGVWYTAGSNSCIYSNPHGELGAAEHTVQTSNRRFRDDEFLVPLRLTEGRSRIRIRIKFDPVIIPLTQGRPLAPLGWSEMRYSCYSYVIPDFALPP